MDLIQALLRGSAVSIAVIMLARADHGHFHLRPVPTVDVHFAERIFEPDRPRRGDAKPRRLLRADKVFAAIIRQERQHHRDAN